MDIFTKRVVVVTYTDEKYLPRAQQTIAEVRKNGQFFGDLVVMTDGLFKIDPRYVMKMNLLVKEFPDIDVSLLLAKIRQHPFVNSDGREFLKTKQWNKLYVFDTFFKQWDFVLFLDAGMRIFDKLEHFYPQFHENALVAMDDGHPDFVKKFDCQLELTNTPVVEELKKIFDIHSSYFLNCIFLFDTRLIQDTTLPELLKLKDKFPIFRTNEMSAMCIYFHKAWIPMDIYLPDGRILFDWSERDGRKRSSYVSLKYPTT